MAWTTSDFVMRYRARNRFVDVIIETIDGFRRHLTGRNAATLAYYGMLSIFPLLIVATTILGFVLQNRPELRQDIIESAVSQIPVIGTKIRENTSELDGSVVTLVIGLLAALWASMKAFRGLQNAFDDTWEVDVDRRANFFVKRLRSLVGLLIIGTSQIVAVVLSAIANSADVGALNFVLSVAGGLAVNITVIGLMYRYLTSADVSTAMVWPGAVVAGVGFTALQYAGVLIMDRAILNASDTYGTFAGTIALIGWLSLHATIALSGAELDAARHRLRTRAQAATMPSSSAPAATTSADDRPISTS